MIIRLFDSAYFEDRTELETNIHVFRVGPREVKLCCGPQASSLLFAMTYKGYHIGKAI
jgi:hypothetical protein